MPHSAFLLSAPLVSVLIVLPGRRPQRAAGVWQTFHFNDVISTCHKKSQLPLIRCLSIFYSYMYIYIYIFRAIHSKMVPPASVRDCRYFWRSRLSKAVDRSHILRLKVFRWIFGTEDISESQHEPWLLSNTGRWPSAITVWHRLQVILSHGSTLTRYKDISGAFVSQISLTKHF